MLKTGVTARGRHLVNLTVGSSWKAGSLQRIVLQEPGQGFIKYRVSETIAPLPEPGSLVQVNVIYGYRLVFLHANPKNGGFLYRVRSELRQSSKSP